MNVWREKPRRGLFKVKGFVSCWTRNEEGSVLVLVALALVVLLGCTALVADVGLLYSHRARLVNAADAAALAGAQELPDDPEAAKDMARVYAMVNGVASEHVEVQVSDDNRSLTVWPQRSVELLFARALEIFNKEVSASATAAVAPLSGAVGVVPFSIEEQELAFGVQYVLKEGAGNGGAEERGDGRMYGWYSALDSDNDQSGGANDYKERIKYGYPEMLRAGDTVLVETGNMSGPTTQGVEYRIDQCRDGCTFENFQRDCPCLVIIPVVRVVDWEEGCPKCVQIRGFGAFFLEGVEGQGKDSNVLGRFVRTVYPGEMGSGADCGLYAVRLTH